jgi:hypothetical protein
MLDELYSIAPGNEAISFIQRRTANDKYRGDISPQHTIYDLDKILVILKSLDKFAPNGTLMHIRTTDLSKRPVNTMDEVTYAKFVDDVSRQVQNDTQDTIRKNIFPDLHRMGLIIRYDKNKTATDPYRQKRTVYVSLSDQGLKLINATPLNQRFIWSKALNSLLDDSIDTMLNILRSDLLNTSKYEGISKWEYMFFISAINANTVFSINQTECIELINSWRRLSKIQIDAVIYKLRGYMNPKGLDTNKTVKRDFHNWRNKFDRMFEKFNQTVYFQVDGKKKDFERCYLSTVELSTKSGKIGMGKRSAQEKANYFKEHSVNKEMGFELHHVVALSFSESLEQYDMFDNWKNMVYIDAFNHARITQNKNRNVFMSTSNNDIKLTDYNANDIFLVFGENILYSVDKQEIMLDYNEILTKELK